MSTDFRKSSPPHGTPFTPASARPGDYEGQTCQATDILEKLTARLYREGDSFRASALAVADMMYGWWEQGIAGTDDPREPADRARLQMMVTALTAIMG